MGVCYSRAHTHFSACSHCNALHCIWIGLDVFLLSSHQIAYAMVDFKEFFAEMSVAYLSDSYHHLDNEDKDVMEKCCPPLMDPCVLERMQQKQLQTMAKIEAFDDEGKEPSTIPLLIDPSKIEKTSVIYQSLFFQLCRPRMTDKPKQPPCNKFYPCKL